MADFKSLFSSFRDQDSGVERASGFQKWFGWRREGRWEGGVWGKIILRKGDDQLGMIYGIGIGILVKEITFL